MRNTNVFTLSVQTIRATRSYINVEVRAGNTQSPTANPQVRSGPMNQGDTFSYECVFLHYQREANPGVPSSGVGPWNEVSWGNTVDIQ